MQDGGLALYAGSNFGTLSAAAAEQQLSVALTAAEISYWAVDGQYFALTPPTKGFTVAAPWPALGVTVASGATDSNRYTASANSRVAIDTKTTGYVLAYTGWEDYASASSIYSVLGAVTALDPSSGAVKWTTTLPTTALPARVGSAALLRLRERGACHRHRRDGLRGGRQRAPLAERQDRRGELDLRLHERQLVAGHRRRRHGLFGCDDGNFYAVTPGAAARGTQRFKLATSGSISSSPGIGPSGEVYFVSDDGNLYAIH